MLKYKEVILRFNGCERELTLGNDGGVTEEEKQKVFEMERDIVTGIYFLLLVCLGTLVFLAMVFLPVREKQEALFLLGIIVGGVILVLNWFQTKYQYPKDKYYFVKRTIKMIDETDEHKGQFKTHRKVGLIEYVDGKEGWFILRHEGMTTKYQNSKEFEELVLRNGKTDLPCILILCGKRKPVFAYVLSEVKK